MSNPYYEKETYEKHNGIKCLTCNKVLPSKSACAVHKGHEVVYLDKSGEPVK